MVSRMGPDLGVSAGLSRASSAVGWLRSLRSTAGPPSGACSIACGLGRATRRSWSPWATRSQKLRTSSAALDPDGNEPGLAAAVVGRAAPSRSSAATALRARMRHLLRRQRQEAAKGVDPGQVGGGGERRGRRDPPRRIERRSGPHRTRAARSGWRPAPGPRAMPPGRSGSAATRRSRPAWPDAPGSRRRSPPSSHQQHRDARPRAATERRVARKRRRAGCIEGIANGSGMATCRITRSARSGVGDRSCRAASCSSRARSASARAWHSRQSSRWRARSESSPAASQASNSSGVRCGPEPAVISGPSYGQGDGNVSFFQSGPARRRSSLRARWM